MVCQRLGAEHLDAGPRAAKQAIEIVQAIGAHPVLPLIAATQAKLEELASPIDVLKGEILTIRSNPRREATTALRPGRRRPRPWSRCSIGKGSIGGEHGDRLRLRP